METFVFSGLIYSPNCLGLFPVLVNFKPSDCVWAVQIHPDKDQIVIAAQTSIKELMTLVFVHQTM